MPRKSSKKTAPSIPEVHTPWRVFIVDDDPFILTMLSEWLEEKDYVVSTTQKGSEAIAQFTEFKPNLVITDLRMDDMDGMALLKEIQAYDAVLPVIMLSGTAQIADAVKATHKGVYEFLTKPVDPEDLLRCVEGALKHASSSERNVEFAPEIIHRSTLMANLLKQAQRVAKSHSSVFIGGATGTGKEMLARAIHRGSPRKEHVFLDVNCGALSEQLLESELFGHEKGAFTGAVRKNLGLFQGAHEGSLFLDEVGDMPPNLQVKLLRVLQEGIVKPVGSIESVPIDVRIISATHHDLEAAVKRGEFREDLFYRLNVIPLYMPALSERREDIPLLIEHFLHKQAQKEALEEVPRFSPEALDYMISLPWPGNVRQLQNVVERCSVLSVSPIIPLSMVQQALRESQNKFQTLAEARRELEHHYLNRVLRMVDGKIPLAAEIAECSETEFAMLLDEHSIDAKKFLKEEAAPESDGVRMV